MKTKGIFGMPMLMVVTIIIVIMIVALASIFILTTSNSLQGSFGETVGASTDFACGALGPIQNFACPE